ncbi:MAG TPA: TIGR01777 family oxidoreductase [Aeromicrobium sp.]|nr:TIGR01777 family oxidoreductase [Aeromicrobium sp.]HKY57822.1 TIGR01777 family oxidoreductase [Aeromicrobium sp.]
MKVVVGGASGFLGGPLVDRLRSQGHEVVRLVRTPENRPDTFAWDPQSGAVDQALIDSADVVVNLSGEPISHWPPTKKWQENVLSSRLGATSTLANAIARSPEPAAFLSGSGMSAYGADRGDEILTETSAPGTGFLAEVVHAWEAATQAASDAGSRVCLLRTTLAVHRSGGLLKVQLPAFKLGLGAKLGTGRQHMSLISRQDWVSAVAFLAEHDVSGPVNLGMPGDATNAEFSDALAAEFGHRRRLAVPKFAVQLGAAPVAADLLGSLRVKPKALLDAGFTFEHPDLASVVDAALHQ